MLSSLCKERDSFKEIMNGCIQTKDSLERGARDRYYDYYDGSLFKRYHKKRMMKFDDQKEITIF